MKRALKLLLAALLALALLCASAVVTYWPRWYRPSYEMGRDWPHEPVRPPAGVQPSEPPAHVVLVTLDGIRWQELFDGVDKVLAGPAVKQQSARELLPNIYARLVDEGVAVGHPDATAGFCVANALSTSLSGYQELYSASPTACQGNGCGPNLSETFLTALGRAGLKCEDAAVITSWPLAKNALTALDQTRFRLSAGQLTHDCDDGALQPSNREPTLPTAHPQYRRDKDTARVALALLKRAPPRFLHIGLGDADEHAHENDYASYLEALREHDRFIGELFSALPERTTVLVTTDHGRGRTFTEHGLYARAFPLPESDRTFLLAAGHGVAAQGFVDLSVDRHLAEVGATVAALLGVPEPKSAPLCALFGAVRCGSPVPPLRACSRNR